ncbi:hypothetical protein BCAR13_1350026 [Paraburkholderia caribensis]|nr:hypothetical protein BCAR13_1350026 [Paraburkholderia caribensis]
MPRRKSDLRLVDEPGYAYVYAETSVIASAESITKRHDWRRHHEHDFIRRAPGPCGAR